MWPKAPHPCPTRRGRTARDPAMSQGSSTSGWRRWRRSQEARRSPTLRGQNVLPRSVPSAPQPQECDLRRWPCSQPRTSAREVLMQRRMKGTNAKPSKISQSRIGASHIKQGTRVLILKWIRLNCVFWSKRQRLLVIHTSYPGAAERQTPAQQNRLLSAEIGLSATGYCLWLGYF